MRKAMIMALVSAAAVVSGSAFAQSGPANDLPPPPAMPDAQAQPGESAASEARIRAMLEKQGYGDVQNIQKQGDAYIATATKEGERVQVRVDPQLGQIDEHAR